VLREPLKLSGNIKRFGSQLWRCHPGPSHSSILRSSYEKKVVSIKEAIELGKKSELGPREVQESLLSDSNRRRSPKLVGGQIGSKGALFFK